MCAFLELKKKTFLYFLVRQFSDSLFTKFSFQSKSQKLFTGASYQNWRNFILFKKILCIKNIFLLFLLVTNSIHLSPHISIFIFLTIMRFISAVRLNISFYFLSTQSATFITEIFSITSIASCPSHSSWDFSFYHLKLRKNCTTIFWSKKHNEKSLIWHRIILAINTQPTFFYVTCWHSIFIYSIDWKAFAI